MSAEGDVDEAIIGLANSLLYMLKKKQPVDQDVVLLPDVPGLLVRLFESITSEVIREDRQTNSARTLQTIFDTLSEIMNIPMNHITGVGLVTLDRRQLFDALQIFNDLMKCYQVEDEQTTREKERDEEMMLTLSQLESPRPHHKNRYEENLGQSRDTSTPKLANRQLHDIPTTNPATRKTSQNALYDRNKPFYINQEGPTSTREGPTSSREGPTSTRTRSNPSNKVQTGSVDKQQQQQPVFMRSTSNTATQPKSRVNPAVNVESKYLSSVSSRRAPFVTGKPRVKSFSSKSQTRHPSVSSKHSERSSNPPQRNRNEENRDLHKRVETAPRRFHASHRNVPAERAVNHRHPSNSRRHRPLNEARKGSESSGKSNRSRRGNAGSGPCARSRHGSASSQAGEVFMAERSRRPSVVSTKVKRHPIVSPTDRSRLQRKVKRGELSPQTVSLCSSLKILEEFDYLKRRYKEIQTEIEQHMSKVRDLQAEEVRIEYVLNHVQQQLSFTKSKKNSKIDRDIGLPV